MTRKDMPLLVRICLEELGGKGTLVDVCRVLWAHYEDELKASGDVLYTWQYDIRWAATDLRKSGIMKDASDCPKGVWALV